MQVAERVIVFSMMMGVLLSFSPLLMGTLNTLKGSLDIVALQAFAENLDELVWEVYESKRNVSKIVNIPSVVRSVESDGRCLIISSNNYCILREYPFRIAVLGRCPTGLSLVKAWYSRECVFIEFRNAEPAY